MRNRERKKRVRLTNVSDLCFILWKHKTLIVVWGFFVFDGSRPEFGVKAHYGWFGSLKTRKWLFKPSKIAPTHPKVIFSGNWITPESNKPYKMLFKEPPSNWKGLPNNFQRILLYQKPKNTPKPYFLPIATYQKTCFDKFHNKTRSKSLFLL